MTEQFFLALALLALACRESRRIEQPIPVIKTEKKIRFVKKTNNSLPITPRHEKRN